ncbi:hypothetical protein FHW69_000752 [Luteibacter sp. Sphag1AF]|nr:hypothetical protein [Luteibacter sp. Sphag1AF]
MSFAPFTPFLSPLPGVAAHLHSLTIQATPNR